MADWGELTGNAFNNAMNTSRELAFKKWQAEQETDPQVLLGKAVAQFNAYRMMMGQPPIDPTAFANNTGGSVGVTGVIPQGQVQTQVPMVGNVPVPNTGDVIPSGANQFTGMGSQMPLGVKSLTGKGFTFAPVKDSMGEDVFKANVDVAKHQAQKNIDVSSAMEQKKQESIASAQKTARGTFRALQQFGRSYKELQGFDPNIGKEGFTGWFARRGGEVANYFDKLPETQAMNIQILPMANGIARDIEGGKITDADREIYANAFANTLKNPSSTNIRLASNALIDSIDKGAVGIENILTQLSNSDIDIFPKIVEQVFHEYPDLVEKVYGKGAKVVNED